MDSVYVSHYQPHKVYGHTSVLVSDGLGKSGDAIPRQNLATFDFRFGMPFLLLIMLVVLVVKFRRSIGRMFISVFRFKKFLSFQRAQFLGEGLYLFLIALFSIFSFSLFAAEVVRVFWPEVFTLSFSSAFLIAVTVVLVFFLFRMISSWLIGYVSKSKVLFADIRQSQFLIFAVMNMLLIPTFIVKDFLDDTQTHNVLIILLLVLFLAILQCFFRTLRLFLHQNSSVFFWFLYFCTIEILPFVVCFKYLEMINL
jgi:hypothetical protein